MQGKLLFCYLPFRGTWITLCHVIQHFTNWTICQPHNLTHSTDVERWPLCFGLFHLGQCEQIRSRLPNALRAPRWLRKRYPIERIEPRGKSTPRHEPPRAMPKSSESKEKNKRNSAAWKNRRTDCDINVADIDSKKKNEIIVKVFGRNYKILGWKNRYLYSL